MKEKNEISLVGDFKQETEPLNDGSRGSALYAVSIKLSSEPRIRWSNLFLERWNSLSLPHWNTMHRPGIASIEEDEIWLDGTTIEESEENHRESISKCIELVNKMVK